MNIITNISRVIDNSTFPDNVYYSNRVEIILLNNQTTYMNGYNYIHCNCCCKCKKNYVKSLKKFLLCCNCCGQKKLFNNCYYHCCTPRNINYCYMYRNYHCN